MKSQETRNFIQEPIANASKNKILFLKSLHNSFSILLLSSNWKYEII